ncbi:MAG: gliding motility-associated C-terminal domain-containing protein, partial [Bacteroidales bacterium]|nr:gliding motility-associated C-terminal domain-containing protein [Bacteroidales bacterium]
TVHGDFLISGIANIYSYCDFVVEGNMSITSQSTLYYYGRLYIMKTLSSSGIATINVEGVLMVDSTVTLTNQSSIMLTNGSYMSCKDINLASVGFVRSSGGAFSQIVINGIPTADLSSGYNGNSLDICWNGGQIPPGLKQGALTYCINNVPPIPPNNKCSPFICPSISTTGNTICEGSSATITVSGANTYTWSNGQTNDTIVVNPTITTTYSVTSEGLKSCKHVAIAVVVVNPQPNLMAAGNTICTGNSTIVSASGANAYSWNTGQTSSSFSVAPTITTTYTVTGTTNPSGCTNTATAVVSVNNLPNVTANGNTICTGAITTINASGANNYSWSNTMTGSIITVNPTQTTTYTVTGTDGNSCTNTATATINVNPLPNVTANGATICIGAITNINASGANTYTWSNSDTGSVISVNPTSTTTYTVTGTDGNTCTNTALAVVNVNPLPIVTASGDTICIGAITTINASGAFTYSWSNSDTGSTITINPTSTTTYIVTGTDNNTCTNTATAAVNVNPLPVVTANGNTICIGAIANINASGANTYTWSNSDTGSAITVNPTETTTYTVTGTDLNGCTNTALAVVNVNLKPNVTASGGTICYGGNIVITAGGSVNYSWSDGQTGNPITVNPTSTTTYTVTGTDGNICTNTATSIVTVNPKPNVAATGNTICYGIFSNITASGANTYTWSNSMMGSSITVSPTSTLIYTVTGTDLNGCTNTATATMTVNPNPIIAETPADEYCEQSDGSIKLNISSGTPGFTYSWSNGSTTKDLDSIPAGTYTITVTDNVGCIKVKTIVINNINIYPNGNPSVDTVKHLITHLFIFTWNGTPGKLYRWDFGDGTTSSLVNPVHVYDKIGKYTITLIVTSIEGCEKEYILYVEIINPSNIEVFNIVTPNFDGFNEVFKVKYTGTFKKFSMIILNRWGTKLFETEDIDSGWDPRNRPDGVYYYIIKAEANDDKT